ncbi:hypothetical protein N2152v2_001051 [Parachlorella kessleri]
MTSEDPQQLFERYDRNKSGALEVEELRTLLADMGLLTNKTLAEVDSFVVQQFAAADADKDSKLNLEEFTAYYGKVTAPKPSEVLAREVPEKVQQLRQVFLAFANFGSRQVAEDMDGAKFSKLCKDSKLVGRGLSPTDVDLIFMKAKARGERRITFDQFIQALEQCGEKKGQTLVEVVDRILQSDGPIVNNVTKADFCKFHDDKSYQCGVYGRGGPLTVEVPTDPLAALVSRDTPGRHSSKSPLPSPALSAGTRTPGMLTPSASFRDSAQKPRPSTGGEGTTEELRQVFRAFATFGQGSCAASPAAASPSVKVEMDSVRFAKLCRESGLLGGKLSTTAVDLCFTKVKSKGARKIAFKQFIEAIELLAHEKGCSVEEVRSTLSSCEGPMFNSVTKAEPVRFYDERVQSPICH